MSERDLSKTGEDLETGKELEAARELDEATHEPGSRLERSGSFEQAEAIETSLKELVDSSQAAEELAGDHQGADEISEPLIEKELPENFQQKQLKEKEDIQGVLKGDYGSLIPGKGDLTDPYGKENGEKGIGSDLGIDISIGEEPGIDSSAEDPEGDPFGPGKGPGSHLEAGGSSKMLMDEAEVLAMIESGASEQEIAAKESQLQEAALDEHELVFGTEGAAPAPQSKDKEDPPKPKPKTQSSSPEEDTGSDVRRPTGEEVERVMSHISGDEISTRDPDSPDGRVIDAEVSPKHAEKIEAALEKAQETKHKRKRAGSEVVTDPPAPVGGEGEGEPEPGDPGIGRKKTGQ